MKDLFRIIQWSKKKGFKDRELRVTIMDSDSERFNKIIDEYGYKCCSSATNNRLHFAVIEGDDGYMILLNESVLPENIVTEPIVDFLENTMQECKDEDKR